MFTLNKKYTAANEESKIPRQDKIAKGSKLFSAVTLAKHSTKVED